jgi:hypothetical protein
MVKFGYPYRDNLLLERRVVRIIHELQFIRCCSFIHIKFDSFIRNRYRFSFARSEKLRQHIGALEAAVGACSSFKLQSSRLKSVGRSGSGSSCGQVKAKRRKV